VNRQSAARPESTGLMHDEISARMTVSIKRDIEKSRGKNIAAMEAAVSSSRGRDEKKKEI
jgi:peptidyl-tRNA hydrolase